MAQLQKSSVALRITGDDLTPDEITQLLGAPPTYAQVKGEELISRKSGKVRIAKFGMWQLCAADREPEDMDGQIHEIFSLLTSDISIWRSITAKHDADLFCGLFLRANNEGLVISPESLTLLGRRGIELGLDIYGRDDKMDPNSYTPFDDR